MGKRNTLYDDTGNPDLKISKGTDGTQKVWFRRKADEELGLITEPNNHSRGIVVKDVKPGSAAERLMVRVVIRSIPPPWGSIWVRLALRTHAPWGCIVRVVSQTKTR